MEALIFDFDGVILDSMGVKDRAFVAIFQEEATDEEIERFISYHRENGGIYRFVKIRYFYEEILGQTMDDAKVQEKAEAFGRYVLENINSESALIKDTFDFIQKASNLLPLHIASGALESELKQICNDLKITQYFQSIHGSPTPKPMLISEIIVSNGYNPKKCAMFGDSKNDYDAAKVNKVPFFGYNKKSISDLGEGYLESFNDFEITLS